MNLSIRLLSLILIFFVFFSCSTDDGIDASRIDNKLICGYQGWFNALGDGSPVNGWVHWSETFPPRTGSVNFELYPDISAYSSEELYNSDLATLGDGSRAELFTSYSKTVIDQHFQWMRDYGIHGVALQRFIEEVRFPAFKQNRDSIASWVKNSAENHERLFYLMYDLSGMSGDRIAFLQDDWQKTLVEQLRITESPNYAHQDGKPVIAIWGLGFLEREINAAQSLEIINWFKSEGYFVIGGVPTFWRDGIRDSKPGFESVYAAFDMLSPWTVGRYSSLAEIDGYQETLILDKKYCDRKGILYQPVMFPGFAWSNWNTGPRNQIPRNGGDFLWKQAYNIRSQNISGAYLAMFDEYDEATAILPAADSYLQIPTDQYFLTTSADGRYHSSDFYMRLAGKISRLFLFNGSPDEEHLISPYSEPVFFRTSLEENTDAIPDWLGEVEETTVITNTSGLAGTEFPKLSLSNAAAAAGSKSIRLQGKDDSEATSFIYYKIFDVEIPISKSTYLYYDIFPVNAGGRNIAIDLIMKDGTTLRDSPAVDGEGVGMHPGGIRGQVGEWSTIGSNIGEWLEFKVIDRIVIAYDYGPEIRDFDAFVDNIIIRNE